MATKKQDKAALSQDLQYALNRLDNNYVAALQLFDDSDTINAVKAAIVHEIARLTPKGGTK